MAYTDKTKAKAAIAAWQRANPEAVRAAKARHYAKHAEALKEKRRLWYLKNKEAQAARCAKNYEKSGDAYRARTHVWRTENKDKVAAISASRRAKTAMRTPAWFSELDAFVIEEAYRLAQLRSSTLPCTWDVDHMYPLRSKYVSGLHVHNNVQVIPSIMNGRKGTRLQLLTTGAWLQQL